MTDPTQGTGPPAPFPKAGAKPLSYRERQEFERRQRDLLQQQARTAAAGKFTDFDLERLRTIGGAGLLRPRAERGAPAQTTVLGNARDVVDVDIQPATPEFWIRYLFDEIVSDESKAILAGSPHRALLLDFYNRLFERPDDFESSARAYVVRRPGSILDLYENNRDLLRSHLRAAMDIGFEWMKWPADRSGNADASTAASVSYMLEIQNKSEMTPLVWRTEDNRTLRELRLTGFTRQVTVESRITALGMHETWNPYSTDEVRNKLWYRRQNTDNCLYTGISVALNPYASLVFPKITLMPHSLARVANAVLTQLGKPNGTVEQALLDAHGSVKAEFAPYVARLELPNREFRLVLYSRARAILMALEGKYLDTQGMQARGSSNREQSFPEYGSLGVSGENVFAQVELHRFFHTWKDDDGFTAFVNRAGCELVERSAIVACFGEAKAQTAYYATVQKAYSDVAGSGPLGLRWAAGGSGYENVSAQFATAIAAWVDGKRIALR